MEVTSNPRFVYLQLDKHRASLASSLLVLTLLVILPKTVVAQLTPVRDMVLDNNALLMGNTGNFGQGINGRAHQSEPLITIGGYQFATWYHNGPNNEQDVYLARRDLADPTNTWHAFDTGYDMENGDEDGDGSGAGRWDSHNVIGMGISGDGRIHLAYDHHVDDLRYLTTRSVGKATLSNSDWATQTADPANLFFVPGGERKKFNAQDSGNVTGLTYPRFAEGANGDIIVTYRTGGSGNGDTHFLSYNADTSAAPTIIAGFENWTTSDSLPDFPASFSNTATATYNSTNGSVSNQGASTDGTFGSFTGAAADTTTESTNDGARLTNGANHTYTFTFTDTSGSDTDLGAFHFDLGTFRPNSARTWTLSTLAGSSVSVVADLATGTIDSGTGGQVDMFNVDVDLSGLTDSTLDANGTVIFFLELEGGTPDSGGHHGFLDNVAVSTRGSENQQRWGGSHVVIDGNAGTYSDAYDTSNSNNRNAYLNGMDVGPLGNLHMTWTWRESSQGANHDVMYAYSEDGGITWLNNDGVLVADKNSGLQMDLNSPGINVVELDRTHSLMNQQAQCVDADGYVHVLMWHRRDDGINGEYDWEPGERFSALDSAYYHYHRDPFTGDWTRHQLPTSRRVGTRPKIGYDYFGNVFAVYTSNSDLIIAGATRASNYSNWTLLYEGTRNYQTDAILDQNRLYNDGVLSVYLQERGSDSTDATGTALRVLEFNVAVSPVVASVEIDLGEEQRSTVESFTVYFDGDVDVSPGAVSVVQRSTATEETFEAVTSTVDTQFANGQTTATITFDSHVRNSNGALVDGNYQITLDADLVTLDGVPMREDYVFGNEESHAFFAFFGDSDGNRTVNVFDLLALRQTYNSVSGSPDYDATMDFGADGVINIFDLLPFRIRYLKTIPFTFGSSRSSRIVSAGGKTSGGVSLKK
ncbi:BNR-4 repeat-containing protein [Mariniblastus fucicola]|uniref:Dockerin domain-containing protein n=1 Tax=Mariniblastus fucicola TaxID=980251 RepID=A0A5B9PCL3_9BACT|nr:BNR-4 repeat-containing protein [Mariniblastus fucicola]QEG22895.1 hypothetical protein MFFC18_27830 [Mariniblastus fucicola]